MFLAAFTVVSVSHVGRADPSRRLLSAVPYPSVFHWIPGSPRPWEIGSWFVDGRQQRRFLAAVALRPRPWRAMRESILDSCQRAPRLCQTVDQKVLASRDDATKMEIVFEAYRSSVFCFQPPGDTVTRRGLFDALLMGCIPVVFPEIGRQYSWYFGDQAGTPPVRFNGALVLQLDCAASLSSRARCLRCTKRSTRVKLLVWLMQLDEFAVVLDPKLEKEFAGFDWIAMLARIPASNVYQRQRVISRYGARFQYAFDDSGA